jgi:hypothetical protein
MSAYAVASGPAGPPGPPSEYGNVPNEAALPPAGEPGYIYIVEDTGEAWVYEDDVWENLGPWRGPQGPPGEPALPEIDPDNDLGKLLHVDVSTPVAQWDSIDTVLPQRLRTTAQNLADWNIGTSNGWYRSASSASNVPSSSVGNLLGFAVVYDGNNVRQEVWATSGAGRWERYRVAGAWGAWRPLGAPGYATTFPANPVDGQETILVDSLTAPTFQWRLRYNAGATGANKWECVGATRAVAANGANEAIPWAGGGVWVDTPTVGPSFVVPRAGRYLVECQAGFTTPGAVLTFIQAGVGIGAWAAPVVAGITSIETSSPNVYKSVYTAAEIDATAGQTIRMRYIKSADAGASTFQRSIFVSPVRLA